MHALICVVSDAKKGTSSTAGMQQTVETSTLLHERIRVVPQRMAAIETAIKAKDFDAFAKITMIDSNSFHAVCLDTTSPIFYLNDVSRALIALVEELNRASIAAGDGYLGAYTFDAGPNCVIYAPEPNMPVILAGVDRFFPQELPFSDPFNISSSSAKASLPKGFNAAVIKSGGWEQGSVKSLIHTRIGDGPRRLDDTESLLGPDGMPKHLA